MNGFGRRLAAAGPFEVLDAAGIDIWLAIWEQLLPELDSSREVSPLVWAKVGRGELGLKTGQGFYEWTPDSADALRRRIAHALVEIQNWPREIGT